MGTVTKLIALQCKQFLMWKLLNRCWKASVSRHKSTSFSANSFQYCRIEVSRQQDFRWASFSGLVVSHPRSMMFLVFRPCETRKIWSEHRSNRSERSYDWVWWHFLTEFCKEMCALTTALAHPRCINQDFPAPMLMTIYMVCEVLNISFWGYAFVYLVVLVASWLFF